MKNSLRLGGVATALALVGTTVATDTKADPSGIGAAQREATQRYELAHQSAMRKFDNTELQNELDAAHAQIEELMMQVDSLKQGCVDATSENGCPAGCERKRMCIGDGPGADFWGPE